MLQLYFTYTPSLFDLQERPSLVEICSVHVIVQHEIIFSSRRNVRVRGCVFNLVYIINDFNFHSIINDPATSRRVRVAARVPHNHFIIVCSISQALKSGSTP